MSEFDSIISSLKKSVLDDVIGLYEVISYIKRTFTNTSPVQIMPLTLECVREMLAAGFKAGNSEYSETGYLPWSNQSSDYVIHRIQAEWHALGRLPNIGDIVYFDYEPPQTIA